MQVFVTINNFGTKKNAGVNAHKWLINVYVITYLFVIQVIANVNVINRVILVSIYLDYENCKCRKKLIYKLVEECTETNDEVKLAKTTLAENESKHKCSSCTLHIVLFSIAFTINIGIGTYFVYYKYINRIKKLILKKVLLIKQHFLIELINRKYQRNKH